MSGSITDFLITAGVVLFGLAVVAWILMLVVDIHCFISLARLPKLL
jgi:uncharacterized membrane protein YcjF (UPF0283 family)